MVLCVETRSKIHAKATKASKSALGACRCVGDRGYANFRELRKAEVRGAPVLPGSVNRSPVGRENGNNRARPGNGRIVRDAPARFPTLRPLVVPESERNFVERRACELRRITLPRTWVNRDKERVEAYDKPRPFLKTSMRGY